MRRSSLFTATVVLLVLGIAKAAPGEILSYSVLDLGTLGGWSHPLAVNNRGEVVGDSYTGGQRHAFVYSGGVMTDLGLLSTDHDNSTATDINDSGVIVGYSGKGASFRPFMIRNGTIELLGNDVYGQANGINNSGQVVGISIFHDDVTSAFLWSEAAGMTDIGAQLGSFVYSDAYGLNESGQVVGVTAPGWVDRGFLWDNGVTSRLDDLVEGEGGSRAYRINNLGQVVGESWDDSFRPRAALWQGSAITDLGVLPNGSDSSWAYGINDSGIAVGTSYIGPPGAASSNRAFIWDSVNGMRDLNDLLDSSGSGWVLGGARDVNSTGQIAAWGFYQGGEMHAVLLSPRAVPEPGTLTMLLGLGGMGLVAVWRRRRRSG